MPCSGWSPCRSCQSTLPVPCWRPAFAPAGARWTDVWSGRSYDGGQRVVVDAPLERIPVFTRDDAALPVIA